MADRPQTDVPSGLSEKDVEELLSRLRSQCQDARDMTAKLTQTVHGIVETMTLDWENYISALEIRLKQGLSEP